VPLAGEYETALELIDSAYFAKPSAFAALWSARAMVNLDRYLPPPTNPCCDSPFAGPLSNPCVPRARFEPLDHRDPVLEIENPYPNR